MKEHLKHTHNIFILLVSTFVLATSCQQIPDVEEILQNKQIEESVKYEKLISEVSISLPLSANETGYMVYQFKYDSEQRVESISLKSEYAAGELFISNASYLYFFNEVQMYTSGWDLYTGQIDGSTSFDFSNGLLSGYRCSGIEYIPDYSFGRTNAYSYDNGQLSYVSSFQSGEENVNYTREYEWKNGDIVREATIENGSQVFEITYRYTDYEDKSNLDFLKLAYYLNYYKGLYFMADKVVFKGLSSKHLPHEQIQFTDEETYRFKYEFDEDQFVKKVRVYLDDELFQILSIRYTNETETDTAPIEIYQALSKPDGSKLSLYGTILATTQRGFLLNDYTGNIYVYGGPEWKSNVKAGDYVRVSGIMGTYWNNRELQVPEVEIIGNGKVNQQTPVELTAANITEFANANHTPRLVHIQGVLKYDNLNYNIYLDNSEIQASLEFPENDISQYFDKLVDITGYYLWTSTGSNGKLYMDIILTDIAEL